MSRLTSLRIARFLGERVYDMSAYGIRQLHHRHFFHLLCDQATPEQWQHDECDPSEVEAGVTKVTFDFFWIDLRQPRPALIAGHDEFIPQLIEILDSEL
jgi:hypothetical protein